MTGEWPQEEVDHKDTNPSNDAWSNLRLATRSQQNCNVNIRCDNKTGIKGVWYDRTRNNYQVYITTNKKRIRLGLLRESAAVKLHGEFVRL